MKQKIHGVKIQKCKSHAGVWCTIVTYPDNKTKIFRNNKEAVEQINFEHEKGIINKPINQ